MWSVFRFVHYCAQQKLDATFYPIFWDSFIIRARNAAESEFLSSDATHLLFIDADISFDPEDVLKLIQSNKDVICSPYPKKYIKDNPNDGRPFEPVDFAVSGSMRKVSEKEYEIQSVATGFLLIKRNVFENLIDKYPEIEYVNDIDGYGPGKVMHDFFRVHINPNTKIYESEDWGFCTLWRNMGGKVYARNDISLGHWGWKEYKGNFNNWIKTLEK
jgi:hypothetical protein